MEKLMSVRILSATTIARFSPAFEVNLVFVLSAWSKHTHLFYEVTSADKRDEVPLYFAQILASYAPAVSAKFPGHQSRLDIIQCSPPSRI
jgi:hypothetical protein